MNYQESLRFLDALQFHKIKLGLESMTSFLAKVGQPEKELRVVHVAGTNGKGSVCVTILTLLQQAGFRVGLYTSPHLSSPRERFRINDGYISEDAFARHATRIRDILGQDKITYFEFTTAIGLLWFAESDLDLVLLETGLGGRLDATNVVTPLVSVITNISMDHEAYLGNTIEEVAFEKAGIIKPGVPVVCGEDKPSCRQVISEMGRKHNAPIYYLKDAFDYKEQREQWSWHGSDPVFGETQFDDLRCSMKGDYQRQNASLALATLHLLNKHGLTVGEEQIRRGLLNVQWPGRLEYVQLPRRAGESASGPQVSWLFDGAHNPAGVASLVDTLTNEYSYNRLVVVWGAMMDKDVSATLPSMGELASHIILTQPEGERSATPEELYAILPQSLQEKVTMVADVQGALLLAEKMVKEDDLIVVAGSLYLVGAARTLLVGELVD